MAQDLTAQVPAGDFTLFLASSNPGKVAEFRTLANEVSAGPAGCAPPGCSSFAGTLPAIELLPSFSSFPAFAEDAPTFAENAVGKALYYSRFVEGMVFADDSGLVVPALGGAPGVHSARYAGEQASNAERIAKLLGEMQGKSGDARTAYFVCAIALAVRGRILAVVTDRVNGEILEAPRGTGGFGYDPVFYFPPLQKTFAELPPEAKNRFSHRGKAFRKLLGAIRTL